MRKKIFGLFLLLGLTFGMTMTAHADTYKGASDWQVTFTTDEKMESNFTSRNMDEIISKLQPGDSAIFTVAVRNRHKTTTDWYMTNEVLYSLEDRSNNNGTSGGAYTYTLVYTDTSGNKKTLFDSDTVGGSTISEAGEGLHQATDALKDYFYLDTLTTGQRGQIQLTVELDGETQGNDYQDTLADLQMNFAVELSLDDSNGSNDSNGSSNSNGDSNSSSNSNGSSNGSSSSNSSGSGSSGTSGSNSRVVSSTRSPQTGDNANIMLYAVLAGISGLILLIASLYSYNRLRKQKRGGGTR